MLMMAKAGKRDGFLLEGMACPGGCVAGAGTIQPVSVSTVNVGKFKDAAPVQSCTQTPFLSSLNDVEMSHLITPPEGEAKAYPVTHLSVEEIQRAGADA